MQAQNICDIQVSDMVGSKDHDVSDVSGVAEKTRRMIEAEIFPQSLVVEDRCFGVSYVWAWGFHFYGLSPKMIGKNFMEKPKPIAG